MMQMKQLIELYVDATLNQTVFPSILAIVGICSGEDSTFPATRLCATGGVAALSKGGRAADDTTHQE